MLLAGEKLSHQENVAYLVAPYGATGMDLVTSESCYKVTIFQRNYKKRTPELAVSNLSVNNDSCGFLLVTGWILYHHVPAVNVSFSYMYTCKVYLVKLLWIFLPF